MLRLFDWPKTLHLINKDNRINDLQDKVPANYNSAADYADQHAEIEGVDIIASKIQKNIENFRAERDSVVNGTTLRQGIPNKQLIEDSYNSYVVAAKTANLIIWISRGLFWLFIVTSLLGLFSVFVPVRVVSGLDIRFPLWVITFVIALILKKIADRKQRTYSEQNSAIYQKYNYYIREYNDIFSDLYNEIDRLYLSTLDPTQREIILMRRDLAHHQIKMEEHNEKTLKLNEALLRESKATRRATEATRMASEAARRESEEARRVQQQSIRTQEELLKIEKKKENDRLNRGW